MVRSPQDETDIRMGDEPTRVIQHKGIPGLTDLDRRNHVPYKLQIDLGDNTPTDGRLPEIATLGRARTLGSRSLRQTRSGPTRAPMTAASVERSERLSVRLSPIRET